MVSHKIATWTLILDPWRFWGNPVLEPTTSTPSPRKILDFHDTISKSTHDLGFFNNHTRVSRILAGTFVVFQVLLLFTNASFTSRKFSERQNFGSIALHNSQNIFFFEPTAAFPRSWKDLDKILRDFSRFWFLLFLSKRDPISATLTQRKQFLFDDNEKNALRLKNNYDWVHVWPTYEARVVTYEARVDLTT